jgi:protein-disulfide isomerase
MFEPMYYALFALKDSIGVAPWSRFATHARVPDIAAFDRCMADSSTVVASVRRDREVGDKLGVAGTPTILINGIRYTGGLPQNVLDSLIQVAIASGAAER